MSRKKRKRFKPEEKFNIVKEVVSKTKSVTEIFDEYGIHPNQFYRWQKEFYESALEGFRERSQGRTRAAEIREKERKENEIRRMKDVVAELAAEIIELKKNDTE